MNYETGNTYQFYEFEECLFPVELWKDVPFHAPGSDEQVFAAAVMTMPELIQLHVLEFIGQTEEGRYEFVGGSTKYSCTRVDVPGNYFHIMETENIAV